MTAQTNAARKDCKLRELEERLNSGRPLTATVLGFHLGVDRNTATRIAKAQGLAPEGSTYPWRRVWKHIHGIDGAALARHLDQLKARHPHSPGLKEIDDLEVVLRAPLVKFPTMCALLGEHPDTVRKQIQRGDRSLPFPALDFGPRLQLYRPLEILMWRNEELLLDLLAVTSKPDAGTLAGKKATTRPETPSESRKKALFAPAARSKRKAAV
ncbi:hypothetical protein [uncultured Sulfitobacter sp.]|jgi:hypothetical protein|uniref:hypothetical protein n=1 Tax=uncultured Sulfitobacter sp. TaxID=191468 RepID=UPI0032B1C221|tara:strand:+ start:9080 stop:9715 length:636 start_codon:yes stop_codon:yes gene_type:complete